MIRRLLDICMFVFFPENILHLPLMHMCWSSADVSASSTTATQPVGRHAQKQATLRGAHPHNVFIGYIARTIYGTSVVSVTLRRPAHPEIFLTGGARVHGGSLGHKGPSTQGVQPRRIVARSHANFDASRLSDSAQIKGSYSIDTSVDNASVCTRKRGLPCLCYWSCFISYVRVV